MDELGWRATYPSDELHKYRFDIIQWVSYVNLLHLQRLSLKTSKIVK